QAHQYRSAQAAPRPPAGNNATGTARFIHFAQPRRRAGAGKITRAVLQPAPVVHNRHLMASLVMIRIPAALIQAPQTLHPATQCHHPVLQLQAEEVVSMSLLTSGATVLLARYVLLTTDLQVSATGT